MRSGELQRKEILNLADGSRLGFADHLLVDLEKATVEGLVVCGRLRLWGLLGREEDITIPWEDIQVIGEDAILVKLKALPPPAEKRAKRRLFWREE